MNPEVNGDMDSINGTVLQVPKKGPPKQLSLEKMYQKKSQLEHILLRPDTYIGSVEHTTELMWVYDAGLESMVQKEISFVPGLYKIFDEILVNAADNKQRDPKMDCIKININAKENTISIWNNGQGIPVAEHKDEKMFIPTMIFGHLLTSSNYNDEEEKVTGGRNGYGAKLCNIFSTKFIVETSTQEYKRRFKQVWENNMTKTSEPQLRDATENDYTKVTFCPDLKKFKMEKLDSDIVSLMYRRAYDIAASTRGVKVYLNDTRLQIKSFKDYVELYTKGKEDEIMGSPLKVIYENVNDRWEVAVTMSDKGFQQVSFVNSIATTKGGRHVDHVADILVKQLVDTIKKKNKGGMNIKPFQIKNHMWVFVNCLIVNPTFDSQTKENMTLQAKSFGSKCNLSEKFVAGVTKSGIIESVLIWAKSRADAQLQKACSGKKQNKIKGIPKLEDANDAGSKNSISCTLILTEGDSAKSLAVSGLGVVGRDKYGVFPLKGKLLNVREASHKQIMENAEISNIIKILGLQYKKKYETIEDLKALRYGRLMIMTDQDQDGSHIKGLIINFIHTNWPSLLKLPFLEEFITPIVKAKKNKEVFSFFSLPEFEEWKRNKENWHTYKIKYYKGLGTSTSQEAKEYFSDMDRHRILFNYQGDEDDSHIQMAFSKKHVDSRKEWLTNWMTECKRRAELGLPEDYLYTKTTKSVTYTDFINKELVLFSNMDNERSIPNLLDGLKPGSRKVLYTCLKRNDKREVKVAQLAGSVAEHSAYHHGEASLMSTIINLAQNYVGSNNINLLQPIGQFGTRLQGGKDAASPRYIFTMLSPLTRLIFHPHDDPILKYLRDDNQKIEPEWYIPIIPMVLVNGADGIGTGWMTKIPNYNPREIIEALKKLMRDEEPPHMKPWYKNFRGEIELLGPDRIVYSGEISIINDQKIEITELPIGTWTQAYKESVMEVMLHGSGEKSPAIISDYKEYNTDTTIRFVVTLSRDKMIIAENEGLHKTFKLQTTSSISSMCCFDRNNVLKKFDNVMDIIKEFYVVRLEYYVKRKAYLEGILEAETKKISNQARFIIEKCDGKLTIENKKKKAMIEELVKRGYDSDPVKMWKIQQDKDAVLEEEGEKTEDEQQPEEDINGPDFDYLLGMTLWSLTKEKKDELLRKRDEKQQELLILQGKTPKDLWTADLDDLLKKLDEVEEKERKELGKKPTNQPTKTNKGRLVVNKKDALKETMPSPIAIRVQPTINEELKKKFEKLLQSKENKGKRTKKIKEEKDIFDAMADGSEKPRTTPEGKKTKASKKDLKQTKLDFKSKKGSPKKMTGSFSDDDSDVSFSNLDDDKVASQPIRATSRRSAAANIKFNFDDSDDDVFENNDVDNGKTDKDMDNDYDDIFDSDDGDGKPKKPAIPKKAVKKPATKSSFTDSDSDFGTKNYSKKEDEMSSDALFDSILKSGPKKNNKINSSGDEAPPKKKPAKAPAPKKLTESKPKTKKPVQKRAKLLSSDSDSDFGARSSKSGSKKKKISKSESEDAFSDDTETTTKAPARQTSGRARKPTSYKVDLTDSDE